MTDPEPPELLLLSVFRAVPGAVNQQSLMLSSMQDGPVMSCEVPPNAFL